jgi:4-hydroxy-2-oxoglutarate aldolase
MQSIRIKGIIPPIATPFAENRVACDRLAENVSRWSQTGISGILALGSNGEYVYLSEKEKLQVVDTVARNAPSGMLVMAGTGCESTAETIRLTQACADQGAQAALVVTPGYYGGQMTPAAMLRHFTAVADASPIPILLYNVPKFTHVNLQAETVAQLSQHPNIVGIKDSTGDVAQLGALLNATDPQFAVLVGTAGALCAALALGCPGGVLALANVAPEACVQIQAHMDRNELEQARRLQLRMLPLNAAVTGIYGVAGLKYALDRTGYYGGAPRAPLLPLDQDGRQAVDRSLAQAGLL